MTSVVEGWEKIQVKVFTRWINAKLVQATGKSPIDDLRVDLSDGVFLTVLVSHLSPYTITPIHETPKHRLQKMENLNAVFDFMKYNNIHLHNIGSEDIFEGNFKLILGLIWTLILHFSSAQTSKNTQSSAKDNLLRWCQEVTKGYRDVNISNFSTSWNNGLALCAMIHKFHPNLIKYKDLKPENRIQNVTLLLEIASRKLKIPQLIDVEDLACDNPDDKSITAYILEWHNMFADHKLAEMDKENLDPQTSSEQNKTLKPTAYSSALLNWCNDIVKKYNLMPVTDFSSSFQDGVALCAIISEVCGQKFQDHVTDDPAQNFKVSSQMCEKTFGLLVDPTSLKNEENLIKFLTQVKQSPSKPSDQDSRIKEVSKFIDFAESALDLRRTYEERAAHLIECLDEHLEAWGTLNHINHIKTYEDVTNLRNDFKIYQITMKRKWLREKSELKILLGNINTKLSTYDMQPYIPPMDLSPKFVDSLWLSLTDVEKEAFRRINLIAKKVQDELCQQFATLAELIFEIMHVCEEEIGSLYGDLENQLMVLTNLLEKLKPVDQLLFKLQDIDTSCKEADILHNEYTHFTYEELFYDHNLLRELIVEKLSFIETQTQLRESINTRKVSPKQVEEFENIFHEMDKHNHKYLNYKEFEQIFKLLNLELDLDEMMELFEYGEVDNCIKLDGFIKIMTEIIGKDDLNADELIENFKIISNGKLFVTKQDMIDAKLDETVISKMQRTLPIYKEEELDTGDTSYDFIQLISELTKTSVGVISDGA